MYDGEDISAPLVGRYCGNLLPEMVRTRSNMMTVQFVTDSSVTKGGFRAIYTQSHGQPSPSVYADENIDYIYLITNVFL